jgi:hypothetical protein
MIKNSCTTKLDVIFCSVSLALRDGAYAFISKKDSCITKNLWHPLLTHALKRRA